MGGDDFGEGVFDRNESKYSIEQTADSAQEGRIMKTKRNRRRSTARIELATSSTLRMNHTTRPSGRPPARRREFCGKMSKILGLYYSFKKKILPTTARLAN